MPPGQPGEAWLKGPLITRGYHKNPAADKAAFKEGWYRTGDMVELRGDLVYILGRVKVRLYPSAWMEPLSPLFELP